MKRKTPVQAEFNFDPDLVDTIVFEGDGEGDLVEGFFDSDEVVFSHTTIIEIDRTKCVYCGGRKDGWSMGHRANCCESCCRTVPMPDFEDEPQNSVTNSPHGGTTVEGSIIEE